MNQIFNFSAGPSTLPSPVLNKIQRYLLEFGNAKASAIEISH
jgi:phosphoserine aminotransferase